MSEDIPTKCGEIFRYISNGGYLYICFHCGEEFNSFANILQHIEGHFTIECENIQETVIELKIESPKYNSENDDHSNSQLDCLTSDFYQPLKRVFDNDEQMIIQVQESINDSNHNNDESIRKNKIINTIKNNKLKHNTVQQNNNLRHDDKLELTTLIKNITKRPNIVKLSKKEKYAKSLKRREGICQICGIYVTDINRHTGTHDTSRQVQCDYCNKSFSDKYYLLQYHFKMHFNLRPFHCTECDFKFATKVHLRRHMRTHTGEKPYKCEICTRTFATWNTRKNHEKTHTQDRKIACPHCEKMFLTKKLLSCHIGTHTGERPFKCDLCPCEFIASSGLTIHRNRVHKPEGNLNQCNICSLMFKDRFMLRHHRSRDHNIYNGALNLQNDSNKKTKLKQ